MNSDCQAYNDAGAAFGWQPTPLTGCCSAPGVTCDASNHITSIKYDGGAGNNTAGIAHLAALSSLVHLDLSGVNFNGQHLPSEVGNLVALQYLDLSQCGFSGAVPDSIRKLTQLQYMQFPGNSFGGPFPDFFDGLQALTRVDVGFNAFNGSLSSSLLKLPNLTQLLASRNNLSGPIPRELGQLKSLSVLVLDSNQFSGDIPDEIFQLPGLTNLNLDSNQLTGTLSPKVGWLANLTDLYLGNNRFTGRIPATLKNMHWSGQATCVLAHNHFECREADLPDSNACSASVPGLAVCSGASSALPALPITSQPTAPSPVPTPSPAPPHASSSTTAIALGISIPLVLLLCAALALLARRRRAARRNTDRHPGVDFKPSAPPTPLFLSTAPPALQDDASTLLAGPATFSSAPATFSPAPTMAFKSTTPTLFLPSKGRGGNDDDDEEQRGHWQHHATATLYELPPGE